MPVRQLMSGFAFDSHGMPRMPSKRIGATTKSSLNFTPSMVKSKLAEPWEGAVDPSARVMTDGGVERAA